MIVSDTVVSAMASYLEEIWLFYYWFTLPVATQRENRKQLSCLFSCLCLSNISLFIALLVLNTLMQLNVSFLLLVHFFYVCHELLFSLPELQYYYFFWVTHNSSFIFVTASRFHTECIHIYCTFSNINFLRFTTLLAIFNNLLLKLI